MLSTGNSNYEIDLCKRNFKKELVNKLSQQHERIEISTKSITLGQFMKLTNVFDSGGMIKNYLQQNNVFVNNTKENRRGKKLYVNDVVKIENIGTYIVVGKS